MHEYMTRHMVATRPLVYDHQALEPGDEFRCTPDDAGYFTKHGKARDADRTQTQVVIENRFSPAAEQMSRSAQGAIARAFTAAVEAPPETSGVSEVSDGSVVMTAQDWSAPRRRGRPTNAELAERAARAAQPPVASDTPPEDA